MVYFVKSYRSQSEVGDTWTAISRAPYLKADMLESLGDSWNGGGLFIDNETYWIDDGYGHVVVPGHIPFDPSSKKYSFDDDFHGDIYNYRLRRDGWIMTVKNNEFDLYEKELWEGWILQKHVIKTGSPLPGKGVWFEEHELVHISEGKAIRYPDWEWAERDRDRLVWAEKGCLYCGTLNDEGLEEVQLLRDFNEMVFEPIKAPY